MDDLARRETQADLIPRVLLSLGVVRQAIDAALQARQADHRSQTGPSPDRGPADRRSEARPFVWTKVLGEAAMLLAAVASIHDLDDRIKPASEVVAGLLVRHGRGPDLLVALCLEPNLALDHAFVHLHLRSLGYVDADVDRLLAESLRARTPGVPERLPHRELEQQWLAGIWSGDLPDDSAHADTLRTSGLGRPLDVLGCSEQDVYAATHAVLYASDLGRRPVRLLRAPEEIAADTEGALAIALDADNFDLSAELLWTWGMLDLAWSPAAVLAFDILTDRQDHYGFLPGPGFSPEYFASLSEAGQADYRLKTSYHANVAMGLLCAAMLRRGLTPSVVAPPPPPRPVNVADTIEGLIHEQRGQTAWHRAFHRSGPEVRASLAPLVLTLVLRRARDAHDLALLRQGLELALEHHLLDAPAPREAVGLLRRGTMLAQAAEDGVRDDANRPAPTR